MRDVNEKVEAVASYLAIVNVLLACSISSPASRSMVDAFSAPSPGNATGSFRKATRIAGSVGEVMGYWLIFAGFFCSLRLALDGVWITFIGWFLLGAARDEASGVQLEASSPAFARQVMREDFPSVTPGSR